VAYAAQAGEKQFVVVDGYAGRAYDRVEEGSLCFSPDGQRLAFVAHVANRKAIVVDGKAVYHDSFGESDLCFSPDSQRLAYVLDALGQWFVVVNGEQGKPYDGIGAGSVIFSPDSRRLAYIALVGRKMTVVIDGAESESYDSIGEASIAFSPNSRRVAYVALRYRRSLLLSLKESARVVIDGAEEREHDAVVSLPIFSPDSRWVAYAAQDGNRQFVVVDGRAGNPYTQVIGPDAVRRIIFDTPDSLHYLGLKGTTLYLVEETLG
jgi:Tol biopolymer transport system component